MSNPLRWVIELLEDRTLPAVSVPFLTAASDTGISTTDSLTQDTTPTFIGTATPGVLVQLREEGVLRGQVTANAAGNWTLTITLTGDGVHEILARDATNMIDSQTVTVTVDTIAPNVSLADLDPLSDNGFSNSDNITNDNTPTFSGSAEAGARVELREGGTLHGTTFGSSNWSITTLTLSSANHNIFVRVIDGAGNQVDSPNLTVTIDTSAPAAGTPDLIAANDSGSSTTDNITNNSTPTLTGTSSGNALVELLSADMLIASTIATAGGTWSIATPALANGVYILFARATEASGNFVNSGTLTLTIDTTAPTVTDPDLEAASDSGLSDSDNITNDTTPTFRGTAEVGLTVQLLEGTTVLGTAGAGGGQWVITPAALAAGSHTVFTRITDPAGNVFTSLPVTFTIDNVAPTVSNADLDNDSDSGISNVDNLTNDTTATFRGTTEPGVIVELRDGATFLGSTTAALDGNWAITTTSLVNGVNNVAARAIDAAGNLVNSAAALVVTLDTTPPTVSVPDLDAASDSGLTNGDNITNDSTPTLSGTAEVGLVVELLQGSTILGTATVTTGAWFITTGTLVDGEYAIFARTTDAAGNTVESLPLNVTIDTTGPVVSVPDLNSSSDSGLSNADNLTNDNTPTLGGSVEAGIGGELREGTTVLGFVSGDWILTLATMTSAAHNLFVHAVDVAGNVTNSAVLTFTIDTTPPAVSVPDLVAASDLGPSSTDNITADFTPTFSGTAETGATVELREGGLVLQTAAGGTWSMTTLPLANGVHLISARATDAAGNVTDSANLTVTINTSTPNLDPASDSGILNNDDVTSDNTPTFTGTALAGLTVQLRVGTTLLGSAVATGGNWTITSSTLLDGVHNIFIRVLGTGGHDSPILPVTIDTTPPTVTIDQAVGQADPTGANAIEFTVVFSTAVTGFDETDVVLGGTAGASTVEIAESGPLDGTTYTVVVTGMTQPGTVTAAIAAGAVEDSAGNDSLASTSIDNEVTYQLRLFAVGQGKGGVGLVQVLHAADQAEHFSLRPFASFTGDIRVAMGDVNHDGTLDLITAPGRGRQGQVRVFDGVDGTPLAIDGLLPFGPGWKRGLFVAAGDTNSDGFAEIIVGQDQGGGRVRIFDGATGGLLKILKPFGGRYRGGVTVAAGDIDLDGQAEVFTGRLRGPTQVRLFEATGGPPIRTLTAFPGLKLGVNVAAGDVDGDGRAEVIAGLARGHQGLVKVFNASTGEQAAVTTVLTEGLGVRVAAVDTDSDGLAEVVAAAGPGGGPHVKVLNGLTLAEVDSFFAAAPGFSAGFFVG